MELKTYTSILGNGNISLPQVTDSYSVSTTDSYSCNYVNEINDKFNYTQEEQRIGTWIDGKPIYRKVVVYTGAKSNYLTVPHGISNFETVINITGKVGCRILHTAYSSNGTLNTNNFFAFIYLVDTTNIEISLSNFFAEQRDPLIFILEYTKTTD